MIPEISVNELKQLVLALSEHLTLRSRGGLSNFSGVLRTFWFVVNEEPDGTGSKRSFQGLNG